MVTPVSPDNTGPTQTPEDQCGVPKITPKGSPRIVGGEEVIPHSFPWQVSLQNPNGHWCGGSIINKHWIITAAHCYRSDLSVLAGIHDLSSPGTTTQKVNIEKYILHQAYNDVTTDNDIMLLKLSSPLQFNEYASPVCLPDSSSL
jgi:secreted trypsin-like serine protease